MIHRLPCRSVTNCLPSGDTDTAIEVPSVTLMSMTLSRGETLAVSSGPGAAAAPVAPTIAAKATDRSSLVRPTQHLLSQQTAAACPPHTRGGSARVLCGGDAVKPAPG